MRSELISLRKAGGRRAEAGSKNFLPKNIFDRKDKSFPVAENSDVGALETEGFLS